MELTPTQINQLRKKGISPQQFEQQLANFNSGFPFAQLDRAATKGDGIKVFSEQEEEQLSKKYNDAKDSLSVLKFVPASGAATRMFKFMFQALNENHFFLDDNINTFFRNLTKFPFYKTLEEHIGPYNPEDEEYRKLALETLLFKPPFAFGEKPKGLIPFHEEEHGYRLALEEHFSEAIAYAKAKNTIRLHFTISIEHHKLFEKEAKRLTQKYKDSHGVTVEVHFSYQQEHTDMVAVDMNHNPIKHEEGFFFRPGGHGALIENLDELSADLIFIKNIDNVLSPKFNSIVAHYKKVLAGCLLTIQERLFSLQEQFLQSGFSEELARATAAFAKEQLDISSAQNFANANALASFLFKPIRVCGMVKNEGEPGGGPFWVQSNGRSSLQIVEKSQVALNNPEQVKILENATHFNPVDLVCATKNVSGETYELQSFVDEQTGFIAEKSLNGKAIKAQELPGLWNGAMAHWHTLFVEVPLVTFNPVKTVNDLLKENHQP